jgi:hypothetical protein
MKVPLLTQSNGKKSASFTMMIVGFVVITLWLLISIVEEAWGLTFRPFSANDAMAYFTPLSLLYFGRRWTDKGSDAAAEEEAPKSKDKKKTESSEPVDG